MKVNATESDMFWSITQQVQNLINNEYGIEPLRRQTHREGAVSVTNFSPNVPEVGLIELLIIT